MKVKTDGAEAGLNVKTEGAEAGLKVKTEGAEAGLTMLFYQVAITLPLRCLTNIYGIKLFSSPFDSL
ncbi:MAG: hypothetical protein U1B83_00780, partial [Candidatus Cloacimonadaceae bacterium]|nr:hypothetical protein [Candidatus Cloacimonadaceae bacterium]